MPSPKKATVSAVADVTLSITVTDAQATRAQSAFGSFVNGVWTPATPAQMRTAIKAWVKSRTIDWETSQENEASRNTKSAEAW